MNSTKWRDRLTFLAMSLVVGWHTVAMMVAPAPENSVLVHSLRRLFAPYLSLLRLDNPWNFFAPVGKYGQFRYDIEDAAGTKHTFVPTEESAGSISRYVWWREFKYLDDEIMQSPEILGDAVGALLCRQHAALEPRSVFLQEIQEQDFSPADELRGKHPLGPEFVVVTNLRRVECRNGSALPYRSPIRPLRKPP